MPQAPAPPPHTSLRGLLDRARAHARSEREKGAYFEKVARTWLLHDPVQRDRFTDVQPYGEWATARGLPATDTGIDLVATLADGTGHAAIQCKFMDAPRIDKPAIDSFIAAAAGADFAELILIDTTAEGPGPNAQTTMDRLSKPWCRIPLDHLAASSINWPQFLHQGTVAHAPKKQLRPHQEQALQAVTKGLDTADRGKLIMACGTGKTFTALAIAERMAGDTGRVLYMLPSLALMQQTLREWKTDCTRPFTAFSVCSDTAIGKRSDPDSLDLTRHDLAIPATTDAARLARQVARAPAGRMTVIFATYHSIDVLSHAQQDHGLPPFDLTICDEAHRTTGVTLQGQEESAFKRIHSDAHVATRKRLYMTATPRIFAEPAKRKADDHGATLASMDNTDMFGETLYHLGFGTAVQDRLLTDYKVVVLAVDERHIPAATLDRLRDAPGTHPELSTDDATKIIGCYKALTKADMPGEGSHPMQRAIAFCGSIKTSRSIEQEFAPVVQEYTETTPDAPAQAVQVRHIDGTFNATQREAHLRWLRAGPDTGNGTNGTSGTPCRILTNAKLLSEGVDVPALDAILFLHPRKSQVDVVQAVGRVMRRAAGKTLGYVILPVVIPPDTDPAQALNSNERFKPVWQILNALRAHDERLDARINQARLGEDIRDKLDILLPALPTTAQVRDFATKPRAPARANIGGTTPDPDHPAPAPAASDIGGFSEAAAQYELALDSFTRAIMAKIVEKCGTREYWEAWAADIATIAQAHITRITAATAQPGPARAALATFLAELREELNPAITPAEAIEMLAQHLITRPVFDALFQGRAAAARNPVSRAMATALGHLAGPSPESGEADRLERFYASVRTRAEGVRSARARQALILELYDRFFRTAFPMVAARLGIVYTPVDVVDFILHSARDALAEYFNTTMGDPGVHIMDPFTGTGTFITRLLQSGLIPPADLPRKYAEDIHANEVVLLAYYIAAVNIETTFAEQTAPKDAPPPADLTPFTGLTLTDTFQLFEQDRDLVAASLFLDNAERRARQRAQDITLIVGNPPYSAGQRSANDNAANLPYRNLDARIRATYAAQSTAHLKNALYDSYIRALRWASDRIGDSGIIAFVTNAGWIDGTATDGLRKCLATEFSDLYITHLRGDIRKNMLSGGAAGEGANVFGQASMTGIAISILVKNPDAPHQGRIHFHDIGDNLSRAEKLAKLRAFKSINGITQANAWQHITPDAAGIWLNQDAPGFDQFPILDAKRGTEAGLFELYSIGAKTQRDAWACNSSRTTLATNMARMIATYNAEVDRWNASDKTQKPADFIIKDPQQISWTHALHQDLARGRRHTFDETRITPSLYRPFTKQYLYFDRHLNERIFQMPAIFPHPGAENRVIITTGPGAKSEFSVLMTDTLPDLGVIESGQCFPLYLYGPAPPGTPPSRRPAITNAALNRFRTACPDEPMDHTDLFHYIYALLHHPDYRARFKNNLSRALPRIPPPHTAETFRALRNAGRTLGDLHVNFCTATPWPVTFAECDPA